MYTWLAAEVEVTEVVQVTPFGQLATTTPLSLAISMYHGVGPTSALVPAVKVTAVFTLTEEPLAVRPVRQTVVEPLVAQLAPLPTVAVAVGGTGVLVLVGVGPPGVFVLVGVGVGPAPPIASRTKFHQSILPQPLAWSKPDSPL